MPLKNYMVGVGRTGSKKRVGHWKWGAQHNEESIDCFPYHGEV